MMQDGLTLMEHNFPRFKKEWWANRRAYNPHNGQAGVPEKEKSLHPSVKDLVADMEYLIEVWDSLDTCYNRPGKTIAKSLEPVIKFR
jgi:hypothetical protein